MTNERFNELLNGTLSHPLPAFAITRLVLALKNVEHFEHRMNTGFGGFDEGEWRAILRPVPFSRATQICWASHAAGTGTLNSNVQVH